MIEIIIGFSVALLSGLGIGGGGLLVIFLVLLRGTDQLAAQGINLIWFLFSSSAAMVVHLIKRKLNFRLIVWLVLFGSMGAVLGSILAGRVSPSLIRTCFGILLTFSGVWTLFRG